MKQLAICLLAMSACGGGGDGPDAGDPPGGDGGLACNVLLNAGCPAGQKCTWVRVSVRPALGQVACVADGTLVPGGACVYGTAGPTTGFDNCAGGNICFAEPEVDQATGTCREICSLMDETTRCGPGFACNMHELFFANSGTDTPLAGVCDPM